MPRIVRDGSTVPTIAPAASPRPVGTAPSSPTADPTAASRFSDGDSRVPASSSGGSFSELAAAYAARAPALTATDVKSLAAAIARLSLNQVLEVVRRMGPRYEQPEGTAKFWRAHLVTKLANERRELTKLAEVSAAVVAEVPRASVTLPPAEPFPSHAPTAERRSLVGALSKLNYDQLDFVAVSAGMKGAEAETGQTQPGLVAAGLFEQARMFDGLAALAEAVSTAPARLTTARPLQEGSILSHAEALYQLDDARLAELAASLGYDLENATLTSRLSLALSMARSFSQRGALDRLTAALR